MIQPINRSKTFQALVFANTGRNNLAPNPKLKKNKNDADTAPLAKEILSA